MPTLTLQCATCGQQFKRSISQTQFLERTGQRAYCSRACRRQRINRTCELCGKPFEVVPSELIYRTSQWCSRECADLGRRQGEERICKACGKTFYAYPSTVKRQPPEFCSNECYSGEYRAERIRGKNLGKERTPEQREAMRGRNHFRRVVIRICQHCGTQFERSGKNQHSGLRFCGTACWYEYIRIHPEAHPSYKGGHEPFYGSNWKEQRRRARRRDDYTCQRCGLHQTRPALCVHHIRPRRQFERDDFIAMNDLANLITLCTKCHMEVEANPALLTNAPLLRS